MSIIKIDDYECISAKLEDGSHRYQQDDYVVYVPEGTVVPEWALRRYGFWKEDEGKGMLAGSKGDRVKAIRLRGVFSQGLLLPVHETNSLHVLEYWIETETNPHHVLTRTAIGDLEATEPEGMDVAEALGLTKYEPPIPSSMAGDVCRAFVSNGEKQYAGDITLNYDFENYKSVPYIFEDREEVVATEKLHGTMCGIGYIPGFFNEEFFGNGNIFVGSKGLSKSGIVFKNSPSNDSNLYVKALRRLIENGFAAAIECLSEKLGGAPVHVFGEIFGQGVQDLHYGSTEPQFRVFEIAVDRRFLPYDQYVEAAQDLGVEVVPLLYRGPFVKSVLEQHRDGKTTFGGKHIREGIVVRATDGGRRGQRRKIAKMVSPDYLLRKNPNATEFN